MKVKIIKFKTAFHDGLEVGKDYEVIECNNVGFFVKCDNDEGGAFIYSCECELIEE